jgi:DNA-directed RNA polymerase specialized sigma24 family protein
MLMETREGQPAERVENTPAAFGELYRRYLAQVYGYLYMRTGNSADAEDLTSQAFLAALEAFPR